MWKQFIKDYFSFTKRERVAVIVLAVMIILVILLPYYWPVKKPAQFSAKEIEELKANAATLKTSPSGNNYSGRDEEEKPASYEPNIKYNNGNTVALFYFDPNTLDEAGWKKLGLRDKTISTITHYLAKGGKFRKAEDLGKIYGLYKNDYERLLPYVKLSGDAGPNERYKNNSGEATAVPKENSYYEKPKAARIIDINQADTTAFIALPGIGSKLAARIVNFRDKLGGFHNVQQIAETYGLPDSTFQQIKSSLRCNNASVHQFNINTADANTLKQHPYLRWNLANAIVQYRLQHGNFSSVNDLQQISLITPELLEKLKPYLTVE